MQLAATTNLVSAISSFVSTYYASPSDVSTTQVYVEPAFDPADEKQYEKLAKLTQWGVVIYGNKVDKSRRESPPTYQHNAYVWSIAVIVKANKDRVTASPNQNAVFMGDTSPATLTSISKVAQNLDKYLDNHKLGGEVYTSRVVDTDAYSRHTYDGQYHYITLQYEGYMVESNTITA